MNRLNFWAATATLSLAAALPLAAQDMTIVSLQSMTGGAAFVGVPVAEGIQMAVDESNAAGELGAGRKINLIVADDATDRTQTQTLMARHGQNPEVLAVLGPTSGGVAMLGAQTANELQVPILTTSNTPEILDYGPWSYIMTHTPKDSVTILADYAAQELGVQNCAVIGVQNIEVYVQLQNVFVERMEEHGVTISARESVQNGDSDFNALATKVAYSDVDCVMVASYAAQGAGIVVQLRNAGLDPSVRILGLNVFSSPEFRQIAGAAAEGVLFYGEWVPGGFNDYSRDFIARYVAAKGHEPDSWVGLGYGMARVVIEAYKNAGDNPTRESLRDALAQTRDVTVPVGFGNYSLTEDRRPQYGVYVLEIQGDSYVTRNP